MRTPYLIAVGVLFWSSACQVEPIEATWEVSDSAGVTVVTSRTPAEEWVLASEPDVSLGEQDSHEFFRVQGVAFLSGGGFAVANQGSEEVQLFSQNGVFQSSIGREGSGPGEFRGLTWIRGLADSLWAYDSRNGRVSVLHSEAGSVRSFRLRGSVGRAVPLALLDDGTVLAVSIRPMAELPDEGTIAEAGLFSRFSRQGAFVDSVVRLPFMERVVHREGEIQTTVTLPLTSNASIARSGAGFCYVYGPDFDVRCFDGEGALKVVARVPLRKRSVTPTEAEQVFRAEVESAELSGNEARAEALTRARPSMSFPDYFPAFTDLRADEQGRIWARRFRSHDSPQTEWWVFEEGRWIARLVVDPSFSLLSVHTDRVAGVWRNGLGVESVRIYRLAAVDP